MNNQGPTGHLTQVLPAACPVVVVLGVPEAVEGCRDSIVEAAERPLATHRVEIERARPVSELVEDGFPEIDDEVALVDP